MTEYDKKTIDLGFSALEAIALILNISLEALNASGLISLSAFKKEADQIKMVLRAHGVAKKYIGNGNPQPAGTLILSLVRRVKAKHDSIAKHQKWLNSEILESVGLRLINLRLRQIMMWPMNP